LKVSILGSIIIGTMSSIALQNSIQQLIFLCTFLFSDILPEWSCTCLV